MAFSTEAKVGLLVIAGLAGAGYLAVQSGTISNGIIQKDLRLLQSEFTSVEGINLGSKVKMAGVEVGEVTDIKLTPYGSAIIEISVPRNLPLASNVRMQITSSGLIGEKYIGLISEYSTDEQLATDAVNIPSAGAVSPEDIAQNFAKVSSDLTEITTALRSALGGPEQAQKLANIVDSFEGFSTKLDSLLNNDINTDKINQIIDGLAAFSANLEEDGGTLVQDASAAMKSLRKLLESSENGDQEGIFANIDEASKNFAEISRKVNNGEGSLGKLVNDPATVNKIENALDTLGGMAERVENFRTEVLFAGNMYAGEDASKGQFNITLAPRPNRYYVLGVTADGFASAEDRFKSTGEGQDAYANQKFGDPFKFTAQFGHVFENAIAGRDVGMRVGVKENSFGVGVDVDQAMTVLDKKVSFIADLYDMGGVNAGKDAEGNPQLDMMTRVHWNNNFFGQAGYANMLNPRFGAPTLGVGVRFQDDDLKYLVGKAL